MLNSRRDFVKLAGAAVLAAKKKRILILGGTGFLGPATVEAARARGHELTLFNRGKTRPGLFPNIETLTGDRDPQKGEGLKALEGRHWDAVIDNSGYYPRQVSASARLLAPNCDRYIFISSISVYADNSKENQKETAAVGTIADPTVEKITEESYGPLKALCEQAAQAAFRGRATIVRPGYIVGPDDPSGRFTYWPVRIDRGGEVLAPGTPADPVQIIDVRDLGAWLITLVENRKVGVFNATGPLQRLGWGTLLESCQKATQSKSQLVWASPEWVAKHAEGVFPIWEAHAGKTLGSHAWSNRAALGAGLQLRPYTQTVADTLKWYKSQAEGGRTRLAGPSPEIEAQLLAAWKKVAR
jgi:2'-hydroxyisoflavone reductase